MTDLQHWYKTLSSEVTKVTQKVCRKMKIQACSIESKQGHIPKYVMMLSVPWNLPELDGWFHFTAHFLHTTFFASVSFLRGFNSSFDGCFDTLWLIETPLRDTVLSLVVYFKAIGRKKGLGKSVKAITLPHTHTYTPKKKVKLFHYYCKKSFILGKNKGFFEVHGSYSPSSASFSFLLLPSMHKERSKDPTFHNMASNKRASVLHADSAMLSDYMPATLLK